jgi:hypothetical protein
MTAIRPQKRSAAVISSSSSEFGVLQNVLVTDWQLRLVLGTICL